jgi:hypothetical protein
VAVNSFNEGAVSPLLSVWRRTLLFTGVLLLTACGSRSGLPPFTASGFVDDRGVIRIWRKDASDGVRLLSVFSPWRDGETTTSEYRWQGETLSLIELKIYGKPPEHVRVRFDDRGEPSFMQREVEGQKEPLSDDRIALYRYRAGQIRQVSDALRLGRVILRQGRWHANRTVTTCEGEVVKPDLEPWAINHILSRQSRSSSDVSVAWLEAPESSQLLLVANSDFCHWQPTAKTF